MATVESEQAFASWVHIGGDQDTGSGLDHDPWPFDSETENQPLDVDLTPPHHWVPNEPLPTDFTDVEEVLDDTYDVIEDATDVVTDALGDFLVFNG